MYFVGAGGILFPVAENSQRAPMSHFPDGTWVDFVNQVLPPAEELNLRSHLDRGCGECQNDFAVWMLVRESLNGALYQPPEDLVHRIERLYAPAKPWTWGTELTRWAEITFES